MILSQTTACANKFGDDQAIKLIANAGFDAVDFDMSALKNDDSILLQDNFKSYIEMLLDTAKKHNVFLIKVTQ